MSSFKREMKIETESELNTNINKYGQNIYEFQLCCKKCKYGLRHIYDKCKNSDCSLYFKDLIDDTIDQVEERVFEEDIFREDYSEEYKFKEDYLEEYNSELDNQLEDDILEQNISQNIKIHEYYHNGDCVINKYGQCTKGWKYFCCCDYGIESYYTQCKIKTCSRFKHMEEENKTLTKDFKLL